MPILTNLARVDATFEQTDMYDTSTVVVEIPSIKVEKTSSAVDGLWVGDVLTYTITISNIDDDITATGIKFTDTIDPALAILVEDSVVVNNQPLTIGTQFTYNSASGKLDIPADAYTMPEITPGSSYDVTFRVTKA